MTVEMSANFDPVDRPAHYAKDRRYEVIDVLEDWVSRAPGPIEASLQFSCCKYLGRLWDKENPCRDARKARWYLDRLIRVLDGNDHCDISPPVPTYEEIREALSHPESNWGERTQLDFVGLAEWTD